MTPAEAAAPEQSGDDPPIIMVFVVPVTVASTELDSPESEVAAIAITSDCLNIVNLPLFARGRREAGNLQAGAA
jgi:hypothetical protein